MRARKAGPRSDGGAGQPYRRRRACRRRARSRSGKNTQEPLVGHQDSQLGPLVVQVIPQNGIRKADQAVAALEIVEPAECRAPTLLAAITYRS
jgi:hypothetical protein